MIEKFIIGAVAVVVVLSIYSTATRFHDCRADTLTCFISLGDERNQPGY